MRRLTAAVLLPLLAAACATPATTGRHDDPRQRELQRFQGLQSVFREQNMVPQQFDYADKSRVTVDEISLDGWPGNSYLRCRFSYQNRTEKPVVRSWVSLDVLDASGQVVSTTTAKLILPIPFPIERGSYFADEVRTPTLGTHLQPGWTWRVRCESVAEELEEPLDPPLADLVVVQPPPMWIKDRRSPLVVPASINLLATEPRCELSAPQGCSDRTPNCEVHDR